tara:strand:- start:227 stop:1258 length:1032 start_codon:yes stop_codon:yes gene_type:complete
MPTINIDNLERDLGVSDLTPLPRDVSPRQYFRGQKDGQGVIVMVYPDADEESRKELMHFIQIGGALSAHNIKTPQALDVREAQCSAVLEDLGTVSFGRALHERIIDQQTLYTLATDLLIRMRDVSGVQDLPFYEDSRIYANRRQMIDYYMTLKRGAQAREATVQSFLSVWDEIEKSLPPCPQSFVHGDYHLENLMYSAREEGVNRCALIDYQDALTGPMPYDLVNLIEDARIDIPQEIHQAMLTRYCAGMSDEDRAAFLTWFRVLAMQFHGRVIGLFIKLAAEQGRDSYLIHIPRLQNYIKKSLADPVLAPLKQWFEKEGLDFEPLNDLDGEHIRTVFQDTSF